MLVSFLNVVLVPSVSSSSGSSSVTFEKQASASDLWIGSTKTSIS